MEVRNASSNKTQLKLKSFKSTEPPMYDTDFDGFANEIGQVRKPSTTSGRPGISCFQTVTVCVNVVLVIGVAVLSYVVISMQHDAGLVRAARVDLEKSLAELKITQADVKKTMVELHAFSGNLTALKRTTSANSRGVGYVTNVTAATAAAMTSFKETYTAKMNLFTSELNGMYAELKDVQKMFQNDSKMVKEELQEVKSTSAKVSKDVDAMTRWLSGISSELDVVEANITSELTDVRQESAMVKSEFATVKKMATDANAAVGKATTDLKNINQIITDLTDEFRTTLTDLTGRMETIENNVTGDVRELKEDAVLIRKEFAIVNATQEKVTNAVHELREDVADLVGTTVKDLIIRMGQINDLMRAFASDYLTLNHTYTRDAALLKERADNITLVVEAVSLDYIVRFEQVIMIFIH